MDFRNRRTGARRISTLRLFGILPAVCLVISGCAVEYEVGQVWQYQTRPGEEQSRLYIARIDDEPLRRPVYHLFVDGLRLRSPLARGGVQNQMPHIPVDRVTLDRSVTDLVIVLPNPPDVSEGYDIWRADFDKGEAGVFTIPVDEIIQIIETVIGEQADNILSAPGS